MEIILEKTHPGGSNRSCRLVSETHSEKMNNQTECLNPKCYGSAYSRGLCRSCYTTAARLVRKQLTTWEQLIKHGKALESTREYSDQEGAKIAWFLNKRIPVHIHRGWRQETRKKLGKL